MNPLVDPRLSIRPATTADVPTVLGMLQNAEDVRQVAPQESPPLTEASIEAWMDRADRSFVMTRDGRVLGFAALLRDRGRAGRWWLGHVVIEMRSRGMGLGQRFVRALLRSAEGIEGLDEIRLSAFRDNPAARRAYFRCGFTETSRWREGDRILCEMRWENPRRRRGLSRPVAAGLGFVAAPISAMLLPWSARSIFPESAPWGVAALLLFAGATTAIFAWSWYRILPQQGAPLSHRLGRPLIYGALVGISTALVLGVVLLLIHALHWVDLGISGRALFSVVAEGGLQHGVAWGLVLLLARDLAPYALGWKRRSA
jgi:RimJ/RimL family protein N-acetyltransferase